MTPESRWVQRVAIIHWLFLHRQLFRRLLVLLLIFINVIIWGLFVYHLVLYIVYTPAHRQMLVELTKERIDFVGYNQRVAAQPLVVANTTAILLGPTGRGGRYSFVSEVQNINENWLVKEVIYEFIWSGGRSRTETSYFLPGENKYLFSLNEISSALPVDLGLEIKNITWQRVRPAARERLELLKELSFLVIKFTPSLIAENKIFPATLQIEAKNSSAYNFRQIDLIMVAYQGKKIVGLETAIIKTLQRKEKKVVDLNFTSRVDFATEVRIVPQLNPLDPDVFMEP